VIQPILEANGFRWCGWHAYRRALATNLDEFGVPLDHAALHQASPEDGKAGNGQAGEEHREAEEVAMFNLCAAVVQQAAGNCSVSS
jgi:hypothetical protein